MEERTLELNVISAQNLRNVTSFGLQSCHAKAYISSNDKKASTKVDKDGGINPTWNAKLTLTCDERLLHRGGSYITVDIYSHGSLSNKLVGTSRISLLDIGKQAAAAAPPKFLSFDVVRRRSGKVHGVLNVSVKIGEKTTIAQKNPSGKPFSFSGSNYKRLQLPAAIPMGYPKQHPPTRLSPKSETVTSYPPRAMETITPYPPAEVRAHEPSVSSAVSVYPRPKSSLATNMSFSKRDEPVMAYPASSYPPPYPPRQYGLQHYGEPLYYGFQYAGRQQSYYPTTQANSSPYKQQVRGSLFEATDEALWHWVQ